MEEITLDQFREKLSDIYGDGDIPQSYNRMLWYISNMTIGDERLTSQFLLDKFKEHIDEWNLLYSAKLGSQYFPSKALALRKNFYDFLGDKWYEREFSSKKGSNNRNLYLFGTNPKNELKKQFKEFKSIWTEEKQE